MTLATLVSTSDSTTEDETPSFAALGIAQDLIDVLNDLGITEPTPVQAMTIADALSGRDVCGKAQTGSGKTLAFGLPLIERTRTAPRRKPHSLVLVPTRELANQVAETLVPFAVQRGLWLCAVYGGVSMLRQIQALQAGVDIVIATPGRLNDLLERGELTLDNVENVVLDEADQMADMGFLPQVDRILSKIDNAQVMLFSATLDGAIGALVDRYQHDPARHEVISEQQSVDTLSHRFIGVTSETRIAVTARIVAGARRALVFVRTTHGADRIAQQLAREGLHTGALHGRLSQSKRERTLDGFVRGETPVLVATNVAARGLHVDGLDVVVHFDLPEDAKTYVHRSGRTARAGEDGLAVTLCLPHEGRDVALLQRDAGLQLAVVPMQPDDPRLLDLASWMPPAASEFEPPKRRMNPNDDMPAVERRRQGSSRGPAPRGAAPRGAAQRGQQGRAPQAARGRVADSNRGRTAEPAGNRARPAGRPARPASGPRW